MLYLFFSGDPKDILSRLASQIDRNGCANLINVDRHNILDGARRGFNRKKFQNKCKLSVKFSGEYGIDDGGPSREFMRLTLKAIRDSPIFEGSDNAKMICPDLPSKLKETKLCCIVYKLLYSYPIYLIYKWILWSIWETNFVSYNICHGVKHKNT